MRTTLRYLSKLLSTIITVSIIIGICTAFINNPIVMHETVSYRHGTSQVISDEPLAREMSTEEIKHVSLDSYITPEVQQKIQELKEQIELAKNPPPEYALYIIKKGDTIKSIAEAVYGDPNWAEVILADNGMTSSTNYLAGDKLRLYPTEQIDGWKLQEIVMSQPEGSSLKDETPGPDVGNNKAVEAMTLENAIAYIKNNTDPVDTSEFSFIGNARVTGYDPHCKHCCGKTNGLTGSGRPAEFGISVGAAYSVPKGTIVYAEGYGFYRVDDRGADRHSDLMIDIASPSHEVCRFMTGRANLYGVPVEIAGQYIDLEAYGLV